jgi:peptide methionine sulfoxide reductase MsrB
MKIIQVFTLFFIITGCDNLSPKTSDPKLNSTIYVCSKCETILYEEKDMLYQNASSKDFSKSISNKVSYNPNTRSSKEKLFCKKCNMEIGNYIKSDSINSNGRHCIDKNSIILKKILK